MMSMKCYLKIEDKIKDLSNYKHTKDTFHIGNDIIDNLIDHLYRFDKIVYTIDTRSYENKKIIIDIIKTKKNK